MRKVLLHLLFAGALAVPVIGCDVAVDEDADGSGGTGNTGGGAGGGTGNVGGGGGTGNTGGGGGTTNWFGVYIDDTGFTTCKSTNNADGVDLDAVGLFDSAGGLVGYLDFIRGELGTACTNDYTDLDQAKGAPDGTLTENYTALVGGYVVGEFEQQFAIGSSDTITVYEVGSGVGGIDEGYDLYLARELACGGSGRPSADCTFLVGDGEGEGTFNMPAGAF